MIYLDTNICIAAMKGNRAVASRLVQTTGQIGISTIVVAELRFGAENSRQVQANHNRITEFLACASVVPWSAEAAEAYGRIRTLLQTSGELISERDLLIAAAARADDAILVTHNTGEFSRVPGLRLADWLRDQ